MINQNQETTKSALIACVISILATLIFISVSIAFKNNTVIYCTLAVYAVCIAVTGRKVLKIILDGKKKGRD